MSETTGKVRGLYLPQHLWKWLEQRAQKENRSVSNTVAVILLAEKNSAQNPDSRA